MDPRGTHPEEYIVSQIICGARPSSTFLIATARKSACVETSKFSRYASRSDTKSAVGMRQVAGRPRPSRSRRTAASAGSHASAMCDEDSELVKELLLQCSQLTVVKCEIPGKRLDVDSCRSPNLVLRLHVVAPDSPRKKVRWMSLWMKSNRSSRPMPAGTLSPVIFAIERSKSPPVLIEVEVVGALDIDPLVGRDVPKVSNDASVLLKVLTSSSEIMSKNAKEVAPDGSNGKSALKLTTWAPSMPSGVGMRSRPSKVISKLVSSVRSQPVIGTPQLGHVAEMRCSGSTPIATRMTVTRSHPGHRTCSRLIKSGPHLQPAANRQDVSPQVCRMSLSARAGSPGGDPQSAEWTLRALTRPSGETSRGRCPSPSSCS